LTLADAPVGVRVRIQFVRSHPHTSTRLRELGLRENAVIRCLQRGHGNLICQVHESRVGLDLRLASTIIVCQE
jgi:Fe2+ transport system protein FeoA